MKGINIMVDIDLMTLEELIIFLNEKLSERYRHTSPTCSISTSADFDSFEFYSSNNYISVVNPEYKYPMNDTE